MNVATTPFEPPRVLVTDDDYDERFATARVLEREGFSVDQAKTGLEAIAKAEQFMPDIILLDVVMPAPDGFEVCRRIKSEKRFEEISVVMLSNYNNTPEYKAKGLDVGADDFISRPYNRKEFIARINSLLRVKRIEKQLRLQQQWMHVTLTSIGDGLIATDEHEQIVFMNPVAEDLTGWSTREAMGKPFSSVFQVVDDATRQPIESPISNVLKTGRIIELKDNVSLVRKNQEKLAIADSVAPIRQAGDEIIGGVLVFRDITEKKEAQQKLEQALQDWESLFMAIGQMTMILTPDFKIDRVNQLAQERLGVEESAMAGRYCYEVLHGLPGPCRECIMMKALESKHQESGQVKYERFDGDFLVTCTPVLNSEGEVDRIIHIATDVTQIKKVEEERSELEQHLRQAQKLEAIGTLAGGIAHDFNNILSSIIGFTELSLEDVKAGTMLEDNLREVHHAGKRAKDLVKQILTFARQTKEQIHEVAIGPIVNEVLRFLRSSVPANIDITSNLDADANVLADPTRIHQILMNLCTNAVQAMEESGGRLIVETKTRTFRRQSVGVSTELMDGEYIELAVSDTGSGIDPDIQEIIFEPYFSTKTATEGTGLGLSTVHGIVRDCGGSIALESTKGEGSRFMVYLPALHGAVNKEETESRPLARGSERILFIDDELAITKMAVKLLQMNGYQVTALTSSMEALRLFESQPDLFDLVITDMNMPGMDGDQLVEKVKQIRPGIPVILCTGYSKKITEKKINGGNMDAVCLKPLSHKDLALTVRRVLDGNSVD